MQRTRHAGTCSWFTVLSECNDWLTCKESAYLCCYGIPGCGKSVLTSSLIDKFRSAEPSESKSATAFFYCDHADKRTLNPVNIFSSVTQQLLRNIGDLPTSLLDILEDVDPSSSRNLEIEDVLKLLLAVIEKIGAVTLFLDGLDEINEKDRKFVFSILQRLTNPDLLATVKPFLTSRENTSYLIRKVPAYKVHIETATISNDIDSYVKSTVHELIEAGDLVIGNPNLEAEISTALQNGAKGMFLWVKFQLNDLCMAETDAAINQILTNLPQNLGETYDRLLGRIDSVERRDYVKRMFNWIIFAKRPLHITEMREAIAFTIDDKHWDSTKIINDIQRLVRASGNLALIDEDTHCVQLAHYSIQQYLLSSDRLSTSFFWINPTDANYYLGEICVAYLSFSNFARQVTTYVPDDRTATFSTLEKAVGNQSLLRLNSNGANVARIWNSLRGSRGPPPTTIDFGRRLNLPSRDPASEPLLAKFTLLSYVIDNWLYHTKDFEEHESRTSVPHVRPSYKLFCQLCFATTRPFSLRPWDILPKQRGFFTGLPYIPEMAYAIGNGHMPLLRLLESELQKSAAANHTLSNLEDYVLNASRWFFTKNQPLEEGQTSYYIETKDLNRLDHYTSSGSIVSEDIVGWLYNQILRVGREGHVDVIKHLISAAEGGNRRLEKDSRVLSHLLLEAASHGQLNVVVEICGWMNRIGERGSKSCFWAESNFEEVRCNALERAALIGSHEVVKVLESAGCKVSAEFQEMLFCTGQNNFFLDAYTRGDMSVVKCLFYLLGPYVIAKILPADCIDDHEPNSASRRYLDFSRIRITLRSMTDNQLGPNYNEHWTDNLPEDNTLYDLINFCLVAGLKPELEDGQWLLWDAIAENRTKQIDLLLKSGVTFPFTRCIGTPTTETRPQFHILGELGVRYLQPLSWAIIHRRTDVVERLISLGAPLTRLGRSTDYLPLHFAIVMGDLTTISHLYKAGAELKIWDSEGRNILEFIDECCLYEPNKKMIIHYISTMVDWNDTESDPSLIITRKMKGVWGCSAVVINDGFLRNVWIPVEPSTLANGRFQTALGV